MQAPTGEGDTSPTHEELADDAIGAVPDAEDESREVEDGPVAAGAAPGQSKKKKRNKKKNKQGATLGGGPAVVEDAPGTEEQAAIEAAIATLSVDAVEFTTSGDTAAEAPPSPAAVKSPAADAKSPAAQSSPAGVVDMQAAQEESKDATPTREESAAVAEPVIAPAAASPVPEAKSPPPVKTAEELAPPAAASPKAAAPASSPKPASPAPAPPTRASPITTPAKHATPVPAAGAVEAPVQRTSSLGFVDPLTSKDAVTKSYLADTAKAWGGGTSPSPPPKVGSVAVPPGTFYPYEELKALRPESGIDMTSKEQYLSDEDFVKVFKKDRAAWAAQPAWRRQIQKKEAGLW